MLKEEVRNCVRFQCANLTDEDFLHGESAFDILFCRNVLIYFTQQARERVLNHMDRLLAPDGILFVGHAESGIDVSDRFHLAAFQGAFAFHKGKKPKNRIPTNLMTSPGSRLDLAKTKPSPKPTRSFIWNRTSSAPTKPNPPAPLKNSLFGPLDLPHAESLANAGRNEEAIAICRQCLETDGPSAAAYYLLGVILIAQGSASEAERCLNKAVYLDPNHMEAMKHLYLLARTKGNQVLAAQWQRRLDRINARTAAS